MSSVMIVGTYYNNEIFSNTGLGQLAGASLEWSTDPVSSASPHTTVPEDR